ncbi:D-amino-acid dehydrogenase [Roseiarcus fermentans]|uniref:D-amino-acid dehydrogenase n=1 Tax=Roseiarcus fermentans TaxID=1473586 RepID=A0A366F690_9HYPH|nr:FAD-dependent oxidoreductase [Roseiarcus fermentans]RBP09225.1 D-amino-acid dehydrogenase [Roseiarcus fermentans]
MPSRSVDAIVLGAGMVGVSAALALQARGLDVTLVDRRGEAGDETSFGNAGLVQSEAVIPYTLPSDPAEIAAAALNRDPRAHVRYRALPASAPALWQYFQFSHSSRVAETAAAMKPLVFGAADAHRKLAEAAGCGDLLRPTGWIKVWRTSQGEDGARRDVEALRAYGVVANFLDRDGLLALEPHVGEAGRGAAQFPDPLSTPDPGGLTRAYAALFVERGGRFETGDAMTLASAAGGWMVTTAKGRVAAPDVVVALGPWANDLAKKFGLRLPFFVKRGYHMHYEARGNAFLSRPVLDLEKGYLVAPTTLGLRLTTGAEFARPDDPPSSAHIDRLEPFAKAMFPIGARKDAAPWLGRRPCLPDMRPIVGPFPGKPGLWLDFGHQHLGLTLGPITGRLIAEIVTGATPFVDPAPFRAERFG